MSDLFKPKEIEEEVLEDVVQGNSRRAFEEFSEPVIDLARTYAASIYSYYISDTSDIGAPKDYINGGFHMRFPNLDFTEFIETFFLDEIGEEELLKYRLNLVGYQVIDKEGGYEFTNRNTGGPWRLDDYILGQACRLIYLTQKDKLKEFTVDGKIP